MKFLYFILVTVFSLILMLAVSPLRAYPLGLGYASIAGFTAFFFLTVFCFKIFKSKLPEWQIPVALILGFWFLQLPIRIIDFESSIGSLPDSILQTLGIICGFFYWRLKRPFGISIASLGFLLTIFMFFQGYDLWFHKLNFGTFTGQVAAANLPTKFEAFDERKNLITDADFRNKIVLLDFWNTRCGICFEKFPQVEAVYNKYKNDSSVVILAVDKPIEEDKPDEAFQIIRDEGYAFPVVISKDEEMPEKFGVKGYPTTFVINQTGQIVYKGGIEGAVKTVESLKREN